MLHDLDDVRIAIISADPSRRKTGGALLGDRIRMNAINSSRIYMRSIATRRSHTEIPDAMEEVLDVVKAAGYDLIIAHSYGYGDATLRVAQDFPELKMIAGHGGWPWVAELTAVIEDTLPSAL